MKARKTRALIAAGTVSLFLALGYGWFAFGVFSDREFGTLYLFSKHRLSPRFYFYAPIGESDIPVSSLTPSQQRAEASFEDFVERNGGYYRKHRISQ